MENRPSTYLIEEFEEKIALYEEFGGKLFTLVKELLTDAGVSVHSVTYRSKNKASFVKKLRKSGASYEQLADITDVCGLRVITHFADDVTRVSRIIESEFQIDSDNSIDKSAALDPDRFGYLSVHYVLTNNAVRNGLGEYRKFNGLKAEIQIRSILQHAWAEIEHDLGYKSRSGIPRDVRRRFSRLAGLLELADQEFGTIRDELGSYSEKVVDQLRAEPSLVELNAPSLHALLNSNVEMIALDSSIAKSGRWALIEPTIEQCGTQVERLAYFGINTAKELEDKTRNFYSVIERFARVWLTTGGEDDEPNEASRSIPKGIFVFYLCYVLAVLQSKPDAPAEYLEFFNIGSDYQGDAEQLVAVFQRVETAD